MNSGWRGEHLGSCRGINVYVLVALETEDTALMLATCEVLKNLGKLTTNLTLSL